mmetsp:Transcript_105411/g.335555  ORF Transcript_105411/g.335555 Transcript_105411/m.335555 type:complete len:220 (-) Transcript_105411:168-827(-)
MPRQRGWTVACLAAGDSRYGAKWYWARRYKLDDSPHEWYGMSFRDLRASLGPVFRQQDAILDLGCGTSGFAGDAWLAGYKSVVAVDFCGSLVQKLQSQSPDVQYLTADLTDLRDFASSSFGGVFDKGTMDGLLGAFSLEDVARAQAAAGAIQRVLRPGRFWVSVSVSDPGRFVGSVLGASSGGLRWERTSSHSRSLAGSGPTDVHVHYFVRGGGGGDAG